MFKVFWLLRRKPGLTHAQFREHYENSHSRLGRDWFGHLMIGYHRNYIEAEMGSSVDADGTVSFGPVEPEWDCIAEWMMPDEAAFTEITRILAQPEVHAIFAEDEKRFADRTAFRLVRVDVVDDGTGDGHLTTGVKATA
ncbi:EthD domain-containing protein [Novosphingobium bradum]|uniref:EthD domain-containing protein n=1 Tax=Novosphingobium bradum TaxID=1737444 RepID=A0ABV7IKA8_9SPHN